MSTASSMIWTWFADSVSYDNNPYANTNDHKCVCVWAISNNWIIQNLIYNNGYKYNWTFFYQKIK